MAGKVADASVLAALVFREPLAEEAAALIQDVELLEPHLLAYELANTARKKILKEPQQRQFIVRGLGLVLGMNVRWVDVDHFAVLKLAIDTGLTTYDASYLYVANTQRVPLLTFDRRLKAVMENLGFV